jgi:hypothetical protein
MNLSKSHYKELWNKYFSHLGLAIPEFSEYENRQIFINKYLHKFNESHSIKYLLIAEAPPQDFASYIYNLDSKKRSAYLEAPFEAFSNGEEADKIKMLDSLAKSQVLILDLFPFHVKLTTNKRKALIERHPDVFLDFFSSKDNPYSIESRINALKKSKKIFLKKRKNTAFMATPFVNQHLAVLAREKLICGRYSLLRVDFKFKRTSGYQIRANGAVAWLEDVVKNKNKRSVLPMFNCCCCKYDPAERYPPDPTLIKAALGLK